MKNLFLFVVLVAVSTLLVVGVIESRHKVLGASTVNGLSVVTYTNGKTEIIYDDYDYSDPTQTHWTLRTTLSAIPNNNDARQPSYGPPHLTLQGSTWHHAVYTYDDPEAIGCERNILYINRAALDQETFSKIRVPYCVYKTLDTRDITEFFGIAEDGLHVAVGRYDHGDIVAETTLPIGAVGSVAANWENTRLFFDVGECGLDGDTTQLLLWDTVSSTLTDKRPLLRNANCSQLDDQDLEYNRTKDQFEIYDRGSGDRLLLFTIK